MLRVLGEVGISYGDGMRGRGKRKGRTGGCLGESLLRHCAGENGRIVRCKKQSGSFQIDYLIIGL